MTIYGCIIFLLKFQRSSVDWLWCFMMFYLKLRTENNFQVGPHQWAVNKQHTWKRAWSFHLSFRLRIFLVFKVCFRGTFSSGRLVLYSVTNSGRPLIVVETSEMRDPNLSKHSLMRISLVPTQHCCAPQSLLPVRSGPLGRTQNTAVGARTHLTLPHVKLPTDKILVEIIFIIHTL